MQFRKTLFASMPMLTLLAAPAMADKAMLVFDASGSMNAQINGKAKLQIAREVVNGLVQEWPQATDLGLIAYGHREKDNCSDIQTLVKPAADSWPAIKAAVGDVEAKGKTPITEAVRAAAKELKSEEGKATVILVSDGLETCNADPCAAAAELEKSGVDFTVHVVGFGTTAEENRQLQCIADKTGGRFLGAKNAPELKAAMTRTAELVAKPEPVAAVSAGEVIFSDSFDGDDLSNLWEIKNEKKENYLVEKGYLLMTTSMVGRLDDGILQNVMSVADINLDSNWDMSAYIRPEFTTGHDRFQIGLLNDKSSPIRATLAREGTGGRCSGLSLSVSETSEQNKRFETKVFGAASCGDGSLSDQGFEEAFVKLKEQGGVLTLSKRDRSYYAKFTSPLLKKPVVTEDIKVLRSSGRPAIAVAKSYPIAAETTVYVDEVRITRMK